MAKKPCYCGFITDSECGYCVDRRERRQRAKDIKRQQKMEAATPPGHIAVYFAGKTIYIPAEAYR